MNILTATLTTITSSEHLSILSVLVNDDNFNLLLAEQCHELVGEPLKLVFKESEVILSTSWISTTANIHSATVHKIDHGTVLTQVTLTYHTLIITALVPTLSFNTLNIREDDEVYWLIQPSEISLLRETHGI